MRRHLYVAGAALLALVAAFVGGRYSRPARTVETVRVETKTVTVTEWKDRIVEKRVQGPTREVERIVERPGAERVITRWIERGPVTTDTATDLTGTASATTDQASATSRVTEIGRPGWRASVAAGWDPGAPSLAPEVYEARVERRTVGTLWLGAWGRTDGTAGLSVAMEW